MKNKRWKQITRITAAYIRLPDERRKLVDQWMDKLR